MDPLGPTLGVFRVSLRALWPASGVLALLLLPMALTRIARLEPPRWPRATAVLGALLLVPVLLFALAAPLAAIYRIRVHELGLRAYDAAGRFFSVRWSVMTEVSPLQLLGLPYIRVSTTEPGVRLVIPLYLADRPRFAQLVAERAGADHPLSRYLRSADAA